MTYKDPYDAPQMRFAMPRMTPMVKLLMIVNAAVFGVQLLFRFVSPAAEQGLTNALGLNPGWWASFYIPVWQLVTYGFMHATGSPMHLLYNLLMLFFFGTMLEEIIGGRRFLTLYFIATVVGGALHLLAELSWGVGAVAIGASGAVMAVMIAVAVMRPTTQIFLLFIPIQLRWLAIGLVGLDVFRFLSDARFGQSDGVAYMVHLGGALYGFLAVRRGWIWKDLIEERQRKQAVKAHEQLVDNDRRMDELLAKIHREGMNSLSRGEKEFLKRMSGR
jgi:rhomboid family protein